MKSPGQGTSSAEVAALMRLAADLGSKLYEDEWQDIVLCLKEAAESSLPGFAKLLETMDSIEIPDVSHPDNDMELSTGHGDGSEDDNENLQMVAYILSGMNVHVNVQLLVIQESVADIPMCHIILKPRANCLLPLVSAKEEELAARTHLVLSVSV
ncbi:brefeldin A-inhibited guanine nucleotide-exchange protein 1-like [Salvia splendens]|uniref:brefeldin A-inhibited guanine nucleotide-exchange protein 1-like n=1 Tax=Salvia splendens TaxID=180675 RepID=UPI001C27202D|nr:brefeldin A-inhibited guanine nucleotide-exchange protein 1-like [Salvia splendens]